MSTNRIGKTEVYAFINNKRAEVIKEKVDPLREELSKMKSKYLEQLFEELNLEDLYKDTKSLYGKYSILRDKLSYSYGNLRYVTDYLGNIKDLDTLENSISTCISWKNVENVHQLAEKIDDTSRDIRIEFDKIMQMAKACSTGNKAVRILKEIGFDTSSISTAQPKNEVMALNVNKNLLGIK